LSQSYFTGIENSKNTAFKAALKKMFGANMKTPNDLSEPEYDGIYLYKAAVERAGSTNAAKVLKALPTVSFDGPRGVVRMSDEHHAPLTLYLGEVQADGSVKIIKSFPHVSPGDQCPALK
jgi:branched-chain amino acid transport system substrate-binding protein